MTASNTSALSRFRPVYDLSREEGSSAPSIESRRRQDGIAEANELSPEAAIRLSRAIRAMALQNPLPDSTPMIRADRDGR
jgi:hypothetical protein